MLLSVRRKWFFFFFLHSFLHIIYYLIAIIVSDKNICFVDWGLKFNLYIWISAFRSREFRFNAYFHLQIPYIYQNKDFTHIKFLKNN